MSEQPTGGGVFARYPTTNYRIIRVRISATFAYVGAVEAPRAAFEISQYLLDPIHIIGMRTATVCNPGSSFQPATR
jgi:hypothetical protein